MKKLISTILAICLVFAMCACGEKAGASFKLGTGSDTGTYHGYGSVLAQYVSQEQNMSITAIPSGGSQANIEDLVADEVQLGFSQSDVMSYAYNGTRSFEAPVEGFSVIAALYMEQIQLVTADPAIKSVADLKGKKVSVGAPGSGVYYNAIDILAAYDLTLDDIEPVEHNFGDTAEDIKDGKIAAGFIVAGAPTTAITDLCLSKQVYLVNIDAEHADKLLATSKFYSKDVIAKDVYGMDSDTETLAVAAMLLVRDDASEDDVYAITSTILEGREQIQHAKAELLSLEFASSIQDVPFHKGAAKYYKEKGIEVPTK